MAGKRSSSEQGQLDESEQDPDKLLTIHILFIFNGADVVGNSGQQCDSSRRDRDRIALSQHRYEPFAGRTELGR